VPIEEPHQGGKGSAHCDRKTGNGDWPAGGGHGVRAGGGGCEPDIMSGYLTATSKGGLIPGFVVERVLPH